MLLIINWDIMPYQGLQNWNLAGKSLAISVYCTAEGWWSYSFSLLYNLNYFCHRLNLVVLFLKSDRIIYTWLKAYTAYYFFRIPTWLVFLKCLHFRVFYKISSLYNFWCRFQNAGLDLLHVISFRSCIIRINSKHQLTFKW